MKKVLARMLIGLFLLSGIAISSVTYANPKNNHPPMQGPSPDFFAQTFSNDFNLDYDEVSTYFHQGVNPHDMMVAASIAKVSNRSLTKVLSLKTLANTWNDVGQSLGVTKEQIREFGNDMMATKLSKDVSASKDEVLDLIKSGYMPHDIVMAEILSKETQKGATNILSMKKINNRWSEVAQSLGVDNESFNQDLQKYHIMRSPDMHQPHPPFCGPENMFQGPPEP